MASPAFTHPQASPHRLFQPVLLQVLAHPIKTLVICGLATVVLALMIPKLTFSTSVHDLIIQDLPKTAEYEAFKKRFGSEEMIRIVIKADNVFNPLVFDKITRISAACADIDGVARVLSLPDVKKTVDVSGQWNLEQFAATIRPVALFQGNILSADGRTTAITIVLKDGADQKRIANELETLIQSHGTDVALYQIGMPLVSLALGRLTQNDFLRLPPITFLLITAVLWLLFRQWRYVLLSLTIVSVSLTWTFGLMALTGIALSMLTLIVPVFLIAVGTAYCMHITCCHRQKIPAADSSHHAVMATYREVAFPTQLAVLTTMIGLMSLLLNRIAAIQTFAVFACIGMASLLVGTLIVMPALLSFMPRPPSKSTNTSSWLDRGIHRLIDAVVRINLGHRGPALVCLGVFAVFCFVGMTRVRVETNPMAYFSKRTEIHHNFHDIYKHLSGSFPVNVTLTLPKDADFENAKTLDTIARFQQWAETQPGVDKSISVVDYLKLVNYATHRYAVEAYAAPKEDWEARMLFNQYKSLLGVDLLAPFLNPEMTEANVLLLTRLSSSKSFLTLEQDIADHVGQHFSRDIGWTVTGLGVVASASSLSLTWGQIKSLLLTLSIVVVIMLGLFLSFRVALVSLVPNVFPILVVFGFMGWMGIPLSAVTALIASVAIGLAVDDTIHYLVRYNREFKQHLDKERALRATIEHMGRPIIFTSLSIGIGFSVLAGSSFQPTAVFGVMMVITMASALIGDLILLPSLMLRLELVTVWDLVRIKMGAAPTTGIPLFKGLSRTQVHITLLAGVLRRLATGDILFNKGSASNAMFVVISGDLDVIDFHQDHDPQQSHDIQKRIRRLTTGDLVGEMGFLRNVRRSATVVAAHSAELLEINWKMMNRLHMLNPLAGRRFSNNITRILCDRLEDVTHRVAEETTCDDLTGLCTSATFGEILDKEISRARRYGDNLTLNIIGLELSAVNGGQAHRIEETLQSVCAQWARCIRGIDTLSRIDISTFALLLPNADAAYAKGVLHRLSNHLKFIMAATETITYELTVATETLRHQEPDNGETLLHRARFRLVNGKASD